jgi:phosphodiesterase/alkaline phosphatase D-like protein
MKKSIFIILSMVLIISACKKDDDPDPLQAPVATDASDVMSNQFTANWNAVSNATGYELDVATDNAFANIIKSAKNLGPSSTVVNELDGNTEYYYRVRATISGANPSGNSNSIHVTTMPDAPVAIDATNITSDGFTANWEAVDGITDYVLYISEHNIPADPPTFIPGYDGAPTSGTSHTVSGLESNKFYYYAVKAKADARLSTMSNSISVETNN